MSKYDKLWECVQASGKDELMLTFDEIADIAGVALDHSFLNYKKELLGYGYEIGKISLKGQTVRFKRCDTGKKPFDIKKYPRDGFVSGGLFLFGFAAAF